MSSYTDLRGVTFRPISTWPGVATSNKRHGPFRAPWGQTLSLLQRELKNLGASKVVVEIDMAESMIRNDGYPRADARTRSPGVIISLESKHGPLRYPCDTFRSWEDNIRAIALSLENLRAVDRYGVTKRGEQYTGWKALPPSTAMAVAMTVDQACDFIGATIGWRWSAIKSDPAIYRNAYRAAAPQLHPDTGGDTEKFQRLQEARRVLDRHHGIRGDVA